MRTKRPRHLTQAKVRRAIDAMLDCMQTEEFDRSEIGTIDAACDALRKMQDQARP